MPDSVIFICTGVGMGRALGCIPKPFGNRESMQRTPLGWPGSNPDRQIYCFQNHVAMSNCTNWPPKLSTNMVIDHFTLNIQPCMIHFCVRSKILVKMMYQSYIYMKSIHRYIRISSFNFSAQFSICFVQASRLPDVSNWNGNKNAKMQIFNSELLE